MAKFTAETKGAILETLRRMNEMIGQLRAAVAAGDDPEVRRLAEAIVKAKRDGVIQTIPDIPSEDGDPVPFWVIYEMWYDLDSYLGFLSDQLWPFPESWEPREALESLLLWLTKLGEELRNLAEFYSLRPECREVLRKLRRALFLLLRFLKKRRSYLRLPIFGRTYIADVVIQIIEAKHNFLNCVDPTFKYLDCYKLLKEIDDSLLWMGKRFDFPEEAGRALERAEIAKRQLESVIENTPTSGN